MKRPSSAKSKEKRSSSRKKSLVKRVDSSTRKRTPSVKKGRS